jgi:hypothetical protein
MPVEGTAKGYVVWKGQRERTQSDDRGTGKGNNDNTARAVHLGFKLTAPLTKLASLLNR